jgi:hypothetical protein
VVLWNFAQRGAVDRDLTAGEFVEAHEKIHYG